MKRGISVSKIAKIVQCHRSTVYRELKRGSKGSHYCPTEAQVFSTQKRTSARKYRIPKERVDFIRLLLEADWSLEQISSVLTRVGSAVSHEWIYRFVAQDKRLGEEVFLLYRYRQL